MNPEPQPSGLMNEIEIVLMEGIKEIVGPEHARELLAHLQGMPLAANRQAPVNPAALQAVLTEKYGLLSGQGVALRSGRAAFHYGLRRWGEESGMISQEFRLLPFRRRMRLGLEKMAALLAQYYPTKITTREDELHWYWRIEACPAGGRTSAAPGCSLVIGLLQEFMTWSGSGKFYRVRENACLSRGDDYCEFQIDKKAVE
jgi:hypothetical protein